MLRRLIVAAALCMLSMPVSGAGNDATVPKAAGTGTGACACACNYTLSTLYYAYRPDRFDHLYTTSYSELLSVVRAGWTREPDAGRVLLAQVPGAIPLYRLSNSGLADHLYTISAVERDNLMATIGWVYEGIAAYVLSGPACGTLPLYRLYNAAVSAHAYTTDPVKFADGVKLYGCVFDSVAGYIWPSD